MSEDKENGTQRWTAKRRVALVLTILRGETTSQEAARQHGLTVAEIEDWKEKFLSGAENALLLILNEVSRYFLREFYQKQSAVYIPI